MIYCIDFLFREWLSSVLLMILLVIQDSLLHLPPVWSSSLRLSLPFSLPLRSLLKVHLQLRGYSVFIDVEKLEAGRFEEKLIQSVQRARNFILVLSANALDKCMSDVTMKDWVHKVRWGLWWFLLRS